MIEIRHLTKRYGSHTAVSDLSLTVEPGKIYGFLGPNGAGKSTTMNMMTGCLSATEGSVLIDGHDIFEEPDKAKALIGYLPELPPVYPDMTPREYLTFVARAKGVGKADREAQIENALAVTQTPLLLWYLPLMLLCALATGLLTGTAAQLAYDRIIKNRRNSST